jgi:16S rRNA (adenine1518-N6/adenine1519-N6)-dimethyltransferase
VQQRFDLTDFTTLRNFLKRYGVWAKKKLGQHFLVDKSVLDCIIEKSQLIKGEKIVEIGPGHGVLTRALLEQGAIVDAIEIDENILPALRSATDPFQKNLSIFHTHILSYPPPKTPYKIISNIPYHLTSPLLRKFLIETQYRPSKIVFLIQKEVAEKLAGKGGKESSLSLLVKAFGEVKIERIVPPESFFPPPKVDSAIITIDIFANPKITKVPLQIYERMLFQGFKSPRKKLKNVLSTVFSVPETKIIQILEKCGINPHDRAQHLSSEDWENLAEFFFEKFLVNVENTTFSS